MARRGSGTYNRAERRRQPVERDPLFQFDGGMLAIALFTGVIGVGLAIVAVFGWGVPAVWEATLTEGGGMHHGTSINWGLGFLAILLTGIGAYPLCYATLFLSWAFFGKPSQGRAGQQIGGIHLTHFGLIWFWLVFVGPGAFIWFGRMFGIGMEAQEWAFALILPALLLTVLSLQGIFWGLFLIFVGFEGEGESPSGVTGRDPIIRADPSEWTPPSSTGSIEILEAVPGKPVRFRINDVPSSSSNDTWVGIYPEDAPDNGHGEDRWSWLRDIDVNNASLPGQHGGRWSIRVFSDGGYTLHNRVDFDITPPQDAQGGHRWYRYAPDQMTWNEHSHRAQVMGGNLASITSAEENEQVTRIAGWEAVWIGGTRKGSGNGPGADHWYWSDGRPWSYTNWSPGEPNNHGGGENRIQLYGNHGGKWNDVGEGWRGAAVYEMPSTPPTGKRGGATGVMLDTAVRSGEVITKNVRWWE